MKPYNPPQDEKYKQYIDEHTLNLTLVWGVAKDRLVDEWWLDDCQFTVIDSLIKTHDKSKFSDDEFQGYRQWFFPYEGQEKLKYRFDYAWNHHQKANPHHWQYWLMWSPKGTEALAMPFPYIFEMLTDWSAMALKFGDIPSEFYSGQKGEMLLHADTVVGVNNWLPFFDEVVNTIRDHAKETHHLTADRGK